MPAEKDKTQQDAQVGVLTEELKQLEVEGEGEAKEETDAAEQTVRGCEECEDDVWV